MTKFWIIQELIDGKWRQADRKWYTLDDAIAMVRVYRWDPDIRIRLMKCQVELGLDENHPLVTES